MEIYQIWGVVCLIFLFVELMTPSLFFLNFSLGAAASAIFGYYNFCLTVQIIVFVAVSLLCVLILRPILLKSKKEAQNSVIEGKYEGLTAVVSEEIGEGAGHIGKIKIFDEVWRAKSIDCHKLEVGENVQIVKNESLIMYVKSIKENKC